MKLGKFFHSLSLALVVPLMAMAVLVGATMPSAAAPYASVERVSVWDNSCSCTNAALSVTVGHTYQYMYVGSNGLTKTIWADQDLTNAYIQANLGVDARAVLQFGGFNDINGDGVQAFNDLNANGKKDIGEEYTDVREGGSW